MQSEDAAEDKVWGCSLKMQLSMQSERQDCPLIWQQEELSSDWLHYFSDLSALTPISDSRFFLLILIRICADRFQGLKGSCGLPHTSMDLKLRRVCGARVSLHQ